VFSDVKSRRSIAASIKSRALDALSMKSRGPLDALSVKDLPIEDKLSRVAASIKEQEGPAGDNGANQAANQPAENATIEQEAEDEKAELYDEINSLYNMDNPKGDDLDERRSQFSS
jgi:hypothetical protein